MNKDINFAFEVFQALHDKCVYLEKAFEIQRNNYLNLLNVLYRGKLPDFEFDPFEDLQKLIEEHDRMNECEICNLESISHTCKHH